MSFWAGALIVVKNIGINLGSVYISKLLDRGVKKYRRRKSLTKQGNKIAEAFYYQSAYLLRKPSLYIHKIGHIKRKEVTEINSAWEGGIDCVLLVGDAGTGKSGILLDLAKDLHKDKTPLLYIDAKDLPSNEDTSSYIKNRLNIDQTINESFRLLGKEKSCVLIIDQIDELIGTESLKSIISLIKIITHLEGVRVVAAVRKHEVKRNELIQTIDCSWVYCKTQENESTRKHLGQLNILNPSNKLLELGKNLLDLSIIADVVKHGVQVDALTKQIQLWEKYIESITQREGLKTLEYAQSLACENLKSEEPDFPIPISSSNKAARLISRGIIVQDRVGRYIFRHTELRDFLIANYLFPYRNTTNEIANQFGKFNINNILFWLHEHYRNKAIDELASFIENIFFDEFLPFYTKITILFKYSGNIENYTREEINLLFLLFESNNNLKQTFFYNQPHYSWAYQLWENNFFDCPPSPVEKDGGITSFPQWDVQNYLLGVAADASDIVIKHIQTIEAHSFYIAQAIRAICKINPIEAVLVKERIIYWLDDPKIAGGILEVVYDYLVHLLQGRQFTEAFEIYHELSKPRLFVRYSVRKTRQTPREPVISLYENIPQLDYHEINAINEFQKINPEKLCQLLHNNLEQSLRLEGESLKNPEIEYHSWWRVAIEDTGQDLGDTAKEQILKRYVNSLNIWASSHFSKFKEQIFTLLEDERKIFYRIGLYFLRKYPDEFDSSIEIEIMKNENLDDTEIAHEYFLLLEMGFSYLLEENQSDLYDTILSGLPQERIERYKDFYQTQLNESELSLDEYLKVQNDLWIRERLWMIRHHLLENQKGKLNSLVNEYGEPEHPTYYRWMSESGFMPTGSPVPGDELTKLSPDNLVRLIQNWKPDSEQQGYFENEKIEGLAKEVAKLVYENTAYYKDIMIDLTKISPIYASELFFHFQNSEEISPLQWQMLINTSKILLNLEEIRINGEWRWVRQCIVNLLRTGFQNKNKPITQDVLFQARDLLLTLANDPDPSPEDEPLPKIGDIEIFNDPFTSALNRVRPSAIRTLIIYAIYRVNEISPEPRLEEETKNMLQEKLDKTKEKSLSVSSVFGEFFPKLCWLDREWAKQIIKEIFPDILDQESLWLFQSAWDGFIINAYNTDLGDVLKPYYLIASETIGQRIVTRADVIPHFAIHLIYDYLFSDYSGNLFDNDLVPISRFINKGNPEYAAELASACSLIIKSNIEKIDDWWPKIRMLWERRVNEAISSNHSNNFDKEMRKFARLLEYNPRTETIITLYPLLEGMLPHITNITYRDSGWDAVEKFLAKQVEMYPLETIQVYRMMREQRGDQYVWRQETKDAQIIIETGAEKAVSRKETLSLIDYFGSIQNHEFRSIYDRYTQ